VREKHYSDLKNKLKNMDYKTSEHDHIYDPLSCGWVCTLKICIGAGDGELVQAR
jgi:hypothetical protein